MRNLVEINKEFFQVNQDEFKEIDKIQEYCNLTILESLGDYERISSLIREISDELDIKYCVFKRVTHGGYLPIKVSDKYDKVIINNTDEENMININYNLKKFDIKNVLVNFRFDLKYKTVLYLDHKKDILDFQDYILLNCPILIFRDDDQTIDINKIYSTYDIKNVYKLTRSNFVVCLPFIFNNIFENRFRYYLDSSNNLDYDNLIHLVIMVKNAGDSFREVLTRNLPIIDRWTILDTGSTDNTLSIINEVLVGKKKGNLYQEPFINFRESRNRALELAGLDCKYLLMLDDTYIIEGELRNFLEITRGDQFSDSFSLYIKSDDTEYTSNRITKSDRKLRYMYKIHEVITDKNNINVCIPLHKAWIFDYRCDYMEKRTMDRKEYDLKMLFEMVEEEPDNPRHLYYIAQTYNLLEQYDKALEFFIKRTQHPNTGFIQEKIDAYFEAARLCNFKLNKPWNQCEELYLKSYELDKSRPDSYYFIGIHYKLQGNDELAYKYMKDAFEIGYPINSQHSLKPTLSFHFLPKFLVELAYKLGDFKLGEKAAKLFLIKNKPNSDYYSVMHSWHNIFLFLNKMPELNPTPNYYDKPILCFVADGGFEPWTGRDILTKGIGGSETYIIEMARYIQKSGQFNVIVFCNCPQDDIFEDVQYKHLNQYFHFVRNNYVDTCIISRFSEYYPVAINSHVENIYMVLHDLMPSGLVIPRHPKLKNIFCLSEWHVEYFNSKFPTLKDITVPFYYGIDFNLFKNSNNIKKIPHKFIYSSFPNRGLLQLLNMWNYIIEKYPNATLHIYCDVEGKWVNNNYPDMMKQIKTKLKTMMDNPLMNIYYHGWTNKKELAQAWLSSDIWFYPCIFAETFCLTALEAALTKTLAVTCNLAALNNTVGDRGVLIQGDPTTLEWQENALKELFNVMEDTNKKSNLIESNYEWAINMSWNQRANLLLEKYIKPNTLEYKGMYNWTNDIPAGHKSIYKSILNYLNNKYKGEHVKILEIGTYTGTSLIEILNTIPNSTATAVDMWSSYNENNLLENLENNKVEEAFYRNIKMKNMQDRIKTIKGDSLKILFELINKNEKFDFIYVDGSHLCLDCYSDMILSWKLLNKGGILAIDDYLYMKHDIIKSPYEAVNHFMQRFKNEYKTLHIGYRVFLEKI